MYSISKEAAKFKNELNAPEILPTDNESTNVFTKRVKQNTKHESRQRLKETWENTAIHGKYPRMTKKVDVRPEESTQLT